MHLRKEHTINCSHVTKIFFSMGDVSLWRLILKGEVLDDGFRALDDVSLHVSSGEFVGLLGLNGAGKSTLLRTVSGVYSATYGKVSILGDVSGLYELGVSGNEELTGRQFAERWLSIQGIPKKKRHECMDEICEFSELNEYYDQAIRTYSAGMKVRLFFAVATALPERVFLIDEALTVGDEHFVDKCWRRMRERVTQGSSGLFATHDWGAVVKLCRYAYVLEKGQVVDYGRPQGVVQRYLGLETISSDVATFHLQDNCEWQAKSGMDAHFSIPVEIQQDVTVYISATIEIFHPGFGWQNMLHFSGQKVADTMGLYLVDLKIEKLPLAQGEYTLNLFLTSASEGGEAYDCRSWTYDNGLKLVVEGRKRKSVSIFPMLEFQSVL